MTILRLPLQSGNQQIHDGQEIYDSDGHAICGVFGKPAEAHEISTEIVKRVNAYRSLIPIPRESGQSENGWTCSVKLLDAIADEVNVNSENNISWEEIDDVIKALAARGHVAIDAPR